MTHRGELPAHAAVGRRAAARRDRARAAGGPERCCCATSRPATSTRSTPSGARAVRRAAATTGSPRRSSPTRTRWPTRGRRRVQHHRRAADRGGARGPHASTPAHACARATSWTRRSPGCWRGPARAVLTVLGHRHRRGGAGRHPRPVEDGRQPDRRALRRAGGDRHRRQPLGRAPAARAPPCCPGTPRRGCRASTAWPRRARCPTSTSAARSCARCRSTTRSPRAPSSCRSRRPRPGCSGPSGPSLAPGRLFDAGHSRRADRVLVLGPERRPPAGHRPGRPAARDLPRRPALRRDRPARRRAPPGRRCWGRRSCPRARRAASSACARPALAQVETRIGAVDLIARQAPAGAEPGDPAPAEGRRPARSAPAARRR